MSFLLLCFLAIVWIILNTFLTLRELKTIKQRKESIEVFETNVLLHLEDISDSLEDLYALSYSNQFSEDEIDIKNNGSPNTDRVGDFYE